jgi:hypothetical protein
METQQTTEPAKPRFTDGLKVKGYKSRCCQAPKRTTTNHYGAIYQSCPKCGRLTPWDCDEPLPAGMAMPEEWKIVKLGDVATVTKRTTGFPI